MDTASPHDDADSPADPTPAAATDPAAAAATDAVAEADTATDAVTVAATATDADAVDATDPVAAAAAAAAPKRSRRRRWPRRLLIGVLALFLLATSSSLIYNAATGTPAAEPTGLKFVTADGIRTRYLEWGDSGPTVVLVHGFAESADTFDPLGTALAAAHRRVYALDLTGWGYSQRVGPYDVAHQAQQLLGFLDALHLKAPILVGHSTGAAVVAQAVLEDPSRASGLVFLDGDGLDTGAGAGANWLESIIVNPYRTTLLRLALSQDWVIRKIYDSNCGPGCPSLDAAGVDQWRRPLEVAGAQDALWQELSIVGLPAARIADLAALRMPKAVVFGADDTVFAASAPYDTAKRIGAPPPTVIPGARHLSFISNPKQVAAAITRLPAPAG
jgi:pimeloyl-ACP methyl ester carboxylesterase